MVVYNRKNTTSTTTVRKDVTDPKTPRSHPLEEQLTSEYPPRPEIVKNV